MEFMLYATHNTQVFPFKFCFNVLLIITSIPCLLGNGRWCVMVSMVISQYKVTLLYLLLW